MTRHAAALASLPGRLAAAREALGLTLVTLAERTAIRLPSLSEFERGLRVPTLEQAARLGDALGVEIFPRK